MSIASILRRHMPNGKPPQSARRCRRDAGAARRCHTAAIRIIVHTTFAGHALCLHKQIEQFKPDLIVSVHAPYGVLDFDGPPPAPEKLGSLFLDQVGIYPGSLGNYGGVGKGVPVVTIELKHALKLPGSEMASMWADLQDWIDRRLLRLARAAEAEPAARHHPRHD